MKIKIGKHELKLILVFSAMHICLALYSTYYCLGKDFAASPDFLRILMGGIQVEESGNMFCIILYLLPGCLFCMYVANAYMKDLKTNFVYIFLRTNRRELWLRGALGKTALSTIYYEGLFGIFVIAIKLFMWHEICFSVREFLTMLILACLQLLMLVLFSNVLLLFLSETASVFGTLLEFGVPILITGIFYENNGMWQYPAKWILFNFGNYNYMRACNMPNIIAIVGIPVVCIAIYIIAVWRINKYELI